MHRKHIELILMALFFVCCFFASNSHAASQPVQSTAQAAPIIPVMGFKSWKSQRVEQASKALVEYRLKQQGKAVEASSAQPTKGVSANPGEALRQLEFNVEIAKGLTIHDYFALYLKDKSTSEISEIVKMLSPEELSELLIAYRKQLFDPEIGEKQQISQPAQQL